MAVSQKAIPLHGVDVDTSELYIDELKAIFLKNISSAANDNVRASLKEGTNAFSFTPVESNSQFCNIELPEGNNYACGFKYFKEINQAFVCVHNSLGNHLIYRIRGKDGMCEKVIQKSCLNFQLVPEHFIGETRMAVETVCRFNKLTDKEEEITFLILTDDFNDQWMICVEDAIATDGFDPEAFPYFAVNDDDCVDCSPVRLGLAPNLDCIEVTPEPIVVHDGDLLKENKLNFKTWQFRIKYIDVWRRGSDHGVISSQYINNIGGFCIEESNGLPRCLKLKFKAGCPIVDKIQIEFRNCSGNVRGFSVDSDWYKYDVIEKYNNCDDKNWWEREINDDEDKGWTYNAVDNTIEYIFCGDKECIPIPVEETNVMSSYMPRTSGTVVPINRRIELARNMRGFEPLDCEELKKMNITVERPTSIDNCLQAKIVKVVVYGVIYNPFDTFYVPIRKKDTNIVFGLADCTRNNPYTYGQVLPPDQEGIVAYFVGTSHWAVSVQHKYDRLTGEITKIGLEGVGNNPSDAGRYIPLQRWEYNVLPGTYILRVSSHTSSPKDDYEKTSTYTIGTTDINNVGALINEQREFVIDACENDVTILSHPIMIWDLTREGKGCALNNTSNVNVGYLYEDEVDMRPLPLAKVVGSENNVYGCSYTDHNGFYFAAARSRGMQTTLYARKACAFVEVAKSQKSYDNSDTWFRNEKLYVYKGQTKYPETDRAVVIGKINLCDNEDIGVAGVLVILAREGYTFTNSDGTFRLIAHDDMDHPTRSDKVYYSQKGTCQLLACGSGCDFCFDSPTVVIPACDSENVREVFVDDIAVKINGFGKSGPTMGGRYGVGIVLHDWLGRQTFVQMEDKHYINIPTLQNTGVYEYSTIKFELTGMTFPNIFKRLSFYITENLNGDYLTWVAERVQFVDNTGKTNNTAPTQIRLYMEGLREFNSQNDFSTNAIWEFIGDKVEETVVTGDQVEVLANGDGTIFGTSIVELVRYNKTGKYVQINYRSDLKDLKDGALIKFHRSNECVNKEFFYELCPLIHIDDEGHPSITEGTLHFVDSYLLSPQIPVPIAVTVKTKDADGNEIETSATDNQLRNFPFLFEHHSPSYFWGDHCWGKGRVNVKNALENQQCIKMEKAVSNVLRHDGLFNGLNTFLQENTKVIEEPKYGGIVGCLSELNTILCICENGSFTVMYNDTVVRINDAGQVVAPSGESRFGQPQPAGIYGCQPQDINTIARRNNVVCFLDSLNAAVVMHNFSSGIPISDNGAKSLVLTTIKEISRLRNITPVGKYFHGCIDPKTNEYILSIAKINQAANEYTNDALIFAPGANDNMVFDLEAKVFRGNRSYTPELFGSMDGEVHDQQLISFRQGKPWIHHIANNSSTSFCNFFGTQCTPVIEIVFNLDNTKVKFFKWLEWYCKEVLFYADRVITQSGQNSRIMPLWWEKRDAFWVADFKCAINTVQDANMPVETGTNALLDGDSLNGRWVKVRLKPKLADRGKYFELTGIVCYMVGAEKSGANG